MDSTNITNLLIEQNIFDESYEIYNDLLNRINSLSPIKSFKVGINSSNEPGTIASNITLITFEDLGKNINLRLRIIDTIKDNTDEDFEFKYLVNIDTLILSFDF